MFEEMGIGIRLPLGDLSGAQAKQRDEEAAQNHTSWRPATPPYQR